MIMKKCTRLIAVSLILVSSAWAGDSDTKRVELAEELLVLMAVPEQIEQSFSMIKEMQVQQMRQLGVADEKIEEGVTYHDKVMDIIARELSWDKLKDEYVQIYADMFSKTQLRELIAFYESPTGKAYIDKTPEIMRRTMSISQQKTMEIMPRIQKLIREAH